MPGENYLNGKKVLLRCDFDVPVIDGKISEKFRIKKQKAVVDFLLKQSTVVIVSHIKSVDSFRIILEEMEELLGHKIKLLETLGDVTSVNANLDSGKLYLMENIRNWPGEEKNDEIFAKALADGFDLYINNAFAVCHRGHTSVSSITKFLPSYAGFLIEEETSQLKRAVESPKAGKVIIIGGAKTKTKIPVIKNFIEKSENILIGGVVGNDILKEMGVDIGLSIADKDPSGLLEGLDIKDKRLIIPFDFNIDENKIFDIGPKTIESYVNIIRGSSMIIWNGPMGLFEDERFSAGTYSLARAIVDSGAYKILGGGDTVAAVNKIGLLEKFDFVSTGGGAMLAFLSGEKLPGLEALGYYN